MAGSLDSVFACIVSPAKHNWLKADFWSCCCVKSLLLASNHHGGYAELLLSLKHARVHAALHHGVLIGNTFQSITADVN